MKRSKKEEIVVSLRKDFTEFDTALLFNYQGLSVSQITDLRNRLREQTCTFRVVKNTLCKLASEGTLFEVLKQEFEGPNAIAFAKENPVPMAKVLTEFAKEHKSVELKAGFLQGKILTTAEVIAVSKLPPREVLLARLLGVIQGPARNLLGILQGPARALTCAINAVKEKKEKEQDTLN